PQTADSRAAAQRMSAPARTGRFHRPNALEQLIESDGFIGLNQLASFMIAWEMNMLAYYGPCACVKAIWDEPPVLMDKPRAWRGESGTGHSLVATGQAGRIIGARGAALGREYPGGAA